MRFPLFSAKIAVAVFAPALAALLLGLFAVSRFDALADRSHQLETARLPRADLAAAVQRQILLAAQAIRGYALTADRDTLEQAKKDLAKAADTLHDAREAATRPGMESLAAEAEKIVYFLDAYKKAAEASVAGNERVDADRQGLARAADAYAGAVAAYIDQKTAQWDKELAAKYPQPDVLRQHARRLKAAQTALAAGRDVSEAAETARANREPAHLTEAIPRFDAAESALRDARNGSDDDARRLTPAFSALSDYRQAVNLLLTDWQALRATGRQILEAERAALAAATKLGGSSLAEAASDAGALAGSLRAARLTLGLAGWAILILGAAFAVGAAFVLGMPVRRCAFFARDLADGRVTGQLAVSGRDEVEQLAESLREMARRIGKRLAR